MSLCGAPLVSGRLTERKGFLSCRSVSSQLTTQEMQPQTTAYPEPIAPSITTASCPKPQA